MSSTIRLCKFCRTEIIVPLEAQRGIECPACGNINTYGDPPLTRYYTGDGPQHGGYQYQRPSLPPPRRSAPPRDPHGGATEHGYYQQLWPPRASDDYNYIEHPPPPRQGSFRPVRPNRYSYQPPPTSPHPMHSPINYQPQPPRRPSHPTYTNDYYQPQSPPPQRSSRPLIKVNSFCRPSLQTSPPQGSRRPIYNGYYQQPSQVSSQQPMDDEDYYYQNQKFPQASHHRVRDYKNGYNEQETPPFDDYQEQLQTSQPRVHTNGYYQQPVSTPWHENSSQWTQDNQLVNY
ncbi:hypothetical protein POM88_034896 [Heracleum sosnowskyi]|uniref:Uncharacterized protein n=1 Tax=Heracleum sosnowskyi TaxID=360622 RepID=A0AAD8HM14_9APIA|nr:hypothetical protein POM88_034896 [Heracleum sosnowskyi]